jgi:hypothetical protein
MAANRETDAIAASEVRAWELWVDRGGGFDILQGERITIGGPGGESPADIAIRCAWRSRVATLVRGPGGDALEIGQSQGDALAAKPLAADQWLPLDSSSSCEATLRTTGGTPQLRYRRPSSLSQTAVVTIASPHRLVRPVDGTIWLDQTILMGPEPFNHVRIEALSSQGWVLFRRDTSWWVRGKTLAAEMLEPGKPWRHADWSMIIRAR